MRNDNWSSRRKTSFFVPVSRRVLFIHCGKQTEPNYFSSVMDVISSGFYKQSKGQTKIEYDNECDIVDPLNMVKDIDSIVKRKNKTYNDVYIVFDKDDFAKDNFDNAIKSVLSHKKTKINFHVLWSNRCIELWFLLHFEFLQSSCSRVDYSKKLSKYLGGVYKKNDKNIFNELVTKGSLEKACKNAAKLLEIHNAETFSNKCPATNVVELFEQYKNYLS